MGWESVAGSGHYMVQPPYPVFASPRLDMVFPGERGMPGAQTDGCEGKVICFDIL